MPPTGALCSIRAARLMASPIAVYSTRRSDPTSPTTTNPVLTPTRTLKPGMPRSFSSRAAYSFAPATISSAARMARSGSSSWASGAPKKARMASPISRARVPSCLYTGGISTSNAPFMISITSSGSSFSAMAVEPLTSEKRMVTIRRSLPALPRVARSRSANSLGTRRLSASASAASVGGGAAGVGASGGAGAGAPILAPHSKQNLAWGGSAAPHCGHTAWSLAPHSRQNLAWSGLSAWHCGHCMSASCH